MKLTPCVKEGESWSPLSLLDNSSEIPAGVLCKNILKSLALVGNSAATSRSSASGQSSPRSHQDLCSEPDAATGHEENPATGSYEGCPHLGSLSLAHGRPCLIADAGLLCFWELCFAVKCDHQGLLMQHLKTEQLGHGDVFVFWVYFLGTSPC